MGMTLGPRGTLARYLRRRTESAAGGPAKPNRRNLIDLSSRITFK